MRHAHRATFTHVGKSCAHLGVVRLGAQCAVLPMRSRPLIFDREILDVFRGVLEIEEKVPPRNGGDFA